METKRGAESKTDQGTLTTVVRKRKELEARQTDALRPFKRRRAELERKQQSEKDAMEERHEQEAKALSADEASAASTVPFADSMLFDAVACLLACGGHVLICEQCPGIKDLLCVLDKDRSVADDASVLKAIETLVPGLDTMLPERGARQALVVELRSQVTRIQPIFVRFTLSADVEGYKGKERTWHVDEIEFDGSDAVVVDRDKRRPLGLGITDDSMPDALKTQWFEALEDAEPRNEDCDYDHHYPSRMTGKIYVPGYCLHAIGDASSTSTSADGDDDDDDGL